MSDPNVAVFATTLPPLVDALDALAFLARHLHPPEAAEVFAALGDPDAAVREVRPRIDTLPDALEGVRSRLQFAADTALTSYDGIRAALEGEGDLRAIMRALRGLALAQEALYPLAPAFPFVSDFFLPEAVREDREISAKVARAAVAGETGLFQMGADAGQRGGYALYVPETYSAERAWPLVVALHGGSGNGRNFLWSWLRDARAFGAILITPTATGSTWALMGEDTDTPNIDRIVRMVESRWRIDPARRLLTGLSDGGTFAYVSGLGEGSSFTHLAPIAASFHPLLAEAADATRIAGLPIHIVHGALDWMFPVELARTAARTLSQAGADVTYSEIEDLSHCYPREMNASLLSWLGPGCGG